MGCCISSESLSPYPTATHPSSSSRAINPSQNALPRPSTVHTTASSQVQTQPPPRPLTEHFTRPLKPHVWSSTSRIWTRALLDREREAFFDTRVAGRQEIWQTIRSVMDILWAAQRSVGDGSAEGIGSGGANATGEETVGTGGEGTDGATCPEDESIATAQMILETSGITIPTGDLVNGVYDSLGGFYALPEFVVSDPINLVQNDGTTAVHRSNDKDGDGAGVGSDNESSPLDEEEIQKRREEKGKSVVAEADLMKIKARLSDGHEKDVVLRVGKADSVRWVTKRVFEDSGLPSTKSIKIIYMGKVLAQNESLIAQGWQEGHVLNAFVFG